MATDKTKLKNNKPKKQNDIPVAEKNSKLTETEQVNTELSTEESENIQKKNKLSLEKTADKIFEYFKENNPIGELIGLFLVFSSFSMIRGYKQEPKIRPTDVWQDFAAFNDMGAIIRGIVIVFVLLGILRTVLKKRSFTLNWSAADSWILAGGVMMFGITSLWRFDKDKAMIAIAIVSICCLILLWFFRASDIRMPKKLPRYTGPALTALMALFVCIFVIEVTLCKHNSFRSSTYDIGIFTQMYHSMITDFSLVTTCEREEAVSHFAVHFSPIYYVLYPFYLIWPSAGTLLVAQGIIIVSGVFPLYMICRKYNLSGIMSAVFCSVYTFSAAIIAPCFYDFHENIFLPPFLMWMFYAIEKDKNILLYIMAALTLMIKEDAALYVLSIALFLIFSRKNLRHGLILFFSTGIIFVSILKIMSSYGEGAMTSRTFSNVMANYDGGLAELVKTAVLNPVYFMSECITEEKIKFILIMMIPLMFMPFITHKASRMFLAVPFIVINLLSGYVYSHDVDFQYVLGSATCLIYASLINISDLKPETVKRVIPIMAAASVFMFTANVTKRIHYFEYYHEHEKDHIRKAAYLDYIPEDASLLCTNFLLPHAANRDEVYMADEFNYEKRRGDYDFVAIETNDVSEWKQDIMNTFEAKGYTVYAEYDSLIKIYKSPNYEVK